VAEARGDIVKTIRGAGYVIREAGMPESRQLCWTALLVLLLTAVSVAWIIAATVSFRDARHEVAEVLDAHLAQTASLISVQHDGDEREDEDEVDTEHAPVLHRYGRRVMVQVWRNGTTLGLHSQHAPDTPSQ
jgi:two-component system sensor histidine kinase QseC